MNSDRQRSVLTDQSARRLLGAIAGGDESSMAAFYGLYEKGVYTFARARLDDPQSAAEIVNEVMLVVWRTAGCFRGQAQVSTWLLGIANNKVIDALRRREKGRCPTPAWQDSDVSWNSGEYLTAEAQDHRAVRECLEALPGAQRQVVHLAFFEDLSYSEIAAILDCPPGTVKTRMYHARLNLKQCLQRKGVEGCHL